MAKMIGVVGGIGSYAGIDLIRKIYDQTVVSHDQEHLPVSMLSVPHKVVDRTEYLLGDTDINPGYAIAEIIESLTRQEATVIGIPCNTAHAPSIFDVIRSQAPVSCKIVHLIDEVGVYLQNNYPAIKRVGVLSTTGTWQSRVYPETLAQYGIEVIQPSEEIQNLFVQPAIYDREYGIKACSNPISETARNDLLMAATYLRRKNVQAVILGCTEIPLALTEASIHQVPLIDATAVLASALIRESLEC